MSIINIPSAAIAFPVILYNIHNSIPAHKRQEIGQYSILPAPLPFLFLTIIYVKYFRFSPLATAGIRVVTCEQHTTPRASILNEHQYFEVCFRFSPSLRNIVSLSTTSPTSLHRSLTRKLLVRSPLIWYSITVRTSVRTMKNAWPLVEVPPKLHYLQCQNHHPSGLRLPILV